MGQRPSSTKKASFTDVLPSSQSAEQQKRVSTTTSCTAREAESPVAPTSVRPTEAAIPAIDAPPHALLRASSRDGPTARPTADDQAFAVPESVRKSRTLETFEHTCSEIVPQCLYVSNLSVARDRAGLVRMGITHVINCCKEVECFQTNDAADRTDSTTGSIISSIAYLQLALRDGVQEDLLPFFPLVVEFIEHGIRHGSGHGRGRGRVLIHCHQGVSRSCAFAIAYVMFRDRVGFQDANALVKAKRAICSPNAAFVCQLLEWEKELGITPATAAAMTAVDDGLYRFAPHAAYDATTLVLKPCYDTGSRRKVTFTERGHTWLWDHGIFVFRDHATQAIVIWKGAQCVLNDGVALARQHVERLVCVLGGDTAVAEMAITVVEGDETESGTDYFDYGVELAWMASASAVPAEADRQTPSLEPEPVESAVIRSVDKPILFLLEGDDDAAAWEQLTNYDSDDLLPSSVLLLVAPTQSFLWLGHDYTNDATRMATLQALCLDKVQQCDGRRTTEQLDVEHQDAESEGFWAAFEAGY